MDEKDVDNRSGAIFRIIIFLAVAGGAIWYLSTNTKQGKSAESILGGSGGGIVSENASNFFNVLGEKLEAAIPDSVKTVIDEKIVKQTQTTVEESEIIKEIKQTIEQATEQITSFPEKQEKDLKRKVIQQVCDDLLESVEE